MPPRPPVQPFAVDAVRSDGGLVRIRDIRDADRELLLALNRRVSDQSIYFRFFSLNRHTADTYADRLLRPRTGDHETLVALFGGEMVGVAGLERIDASTAEVALLIDDRSQHKGIGTLLIEHLAGVARRRGFGLLVAEVLAQNVGMIRVVHSLGFPTQVSTEDEVIRLTFAPDRGERAVEAVENREARADVASLRPLLAPTSIAVVGGGTQRPAVGRAVLRSILQGGFTGTLHVVEEGSTSVLGVPAVASPELLPVAPDLVILAVPAAEVLDVVAACGRRGARVALVTTAGFAETGRAGQELQRQLTETARRHGMRLVGPNCLGLVNTDPAIRLNATAARLPMTAGGLGLVSQSGALGTALVVAADDCGLRVSQFVSIGNKADVSGNDLLLAWEHDPRTSVIALYLESFGNPRKFARIARRVARSKPIVAIKGGRSPSGRRAGQSHTAAAASSDAVVDALFVQAGVLRVDTMAQLLDVARLLLDQPVPAGPRVAILGNSGGAEIVAADAAATAGLTVVDLEPGTAHLISRVAPSASPSRNPIDLGAGASPDAAGAVVRILLAAAEVDAVLTVFSELLDAESGQVLSSIVDAAAAVAKTVAAVQVGGSSRSIPIPGTSRSVPVFTFPEPAAAALGFAHRYGRIRSAPVDRVPRPEHIDLAGARALVVERLAAGGGWLEREDVQRLLGFYAILLGPQRAVGGATAAAQLAESESGVDLMAGAVQDPQFGPVVMLGAGGVLADMIADRQLRLAPLTVADAAAMISGLRTAPLLDGYRGRPVVSRQAIRTLLLRVAALAEDLPDVAELELDPVSCRGAEFIVVGARIRLAEAGPVPDPLLRQLRP